MAVSEIKFYGTGEKLFRQYPILTTNYIWVLLQASYTPVQSHSVYADVSAHVCDTVGYAHVDATGAALINTYDPDFANPTFAAGSAGKYVLLCTKSGANPDKLVGFYDAEVGGTADLEFNTAFVLNSGGVLDYNIEGWTYGGGGGGGGGGGPPPEGAVTEVIVTQFARTGTPSSYPLNFTVPYAKGILATNSTFALYDANNVQKRAQFDAFERWEDTSIKMLHVCCDTSYDAQKTFKVKSGDTQNFANAATIDNAGNLVTVSFNGNDYVTNNSAFTFMNGFRIYALNALDGLEYLSANATTTVVENGQVRAVLRSEGEIKNGSTILFHFILRQYFYPLSGAVEIECTFESRNPENHMTHNTRHATGHTGRWLRISCSELGIKNTTANTNPAMTIEGDSSDHIAAASPTTKIVIQSGTRRILGSNFQGHTFSYSGVGTGSKCTGAISATVANQQIGICYRNMWKEFPSAVECAQAGTKIKFHNVVGQPDTQWPDMSNSNEYLMPNTFWSPGYGIGKTYKTLLLIGGQSFSQIKQINAIYQQYLPQALPTRDYIRSTKAFGDFTLSNNATTTYDNRMESNINVSFWNYLDGATPKPQVQYGWRYFGNRAYGFTKDFVSTTTYPGSTARASGWYCGAHYGADKYFLHFLRTGSEKLWYFSAIEAHNYADLSISHAPRMGYDALFMNAGTTEITNFPVGEPLTVYHDQLDVYCRNFWWAHLSASSMYSFYLMEKNYRYKECIEKQANWLNVFVDNILPKNSYPLAFVSSPRSRPFMEAEREFGNILFNVVKHADKTCNVAYFDSTVTPAINFLINWVKQPADHWQQGAVIGQHNFSNGTGWMWLDNNANNSSQGGGRTSGTGPWQFGIVSAALAYYHQLAIRFNKTLHTDFIEVVRQLHAYIVQWGRDGQGRWLYIEAGTALEPSFGLAYGMGYWGNYFNNASWYAMGLALHNTNLGLTYQNSNTFYGYEDIQFPEQFKIFNT